jgi:hypothetical protein
VTLFKLVVCASSRVLRRGRYWGGTVLIATFDETTGWVGKTITRLAMQVADLGE